MKWLFNETLRRGLTAEKVLADALEANVPDLFITQIEAAAGARRGPRVRGNFGDLVELPAHDIRAQFKDVHFDIQVKLKKHANWRGHGNYYEHGIDFDAYQGYQHLYEFTATRCWMVICEQERPSDGQGRPEPKIIAQWFHRLAKPRIGDADNQWPSGSANFNRWNFLQIIDANGRFLEADGKQVAYSQLEFGLTSKPSIQRPLILPTQKGLRPNG